MDKKEILDILDNAKDERGAVPMRLVRQAFDKLPTIQPVATDTNVGDTISRKGVFIPNITVEMFRNASLVGVEDLMASGEMEDISLPSAQPEPKWIPVSERLPKDGERVLCTHLGGINPNRQVIEHIYEGGQFVLGWEMDMNPSSPTFMQRYMGKVVAWMPLPSPYREDGGE